MAKTTLVVWQNLSYLRHTAIADPLYDVSQWHRSASDFLDTKMLMHLISLDRPRHSPRRFATMERESSSVATKFRSSG